jgi:hypothetical protein
LSWADTALLKASTSAIAKPALQRIAAQYRIEQELAKFMPSERKRPALTTVQCSSRWCGLPAMGQELGDATGRQSN